MGIFKPGFQSPLTTKGDLFTYGTADTKLTAPSSLTDGMILKADSAQSSGLSWAWEAYRLLVTTLPVTAAAKYRYVLISGSSETLTIPNPSISLNWGKVITVQHGGTSLSQVYTIFVANGLIYHNGVGSDTFLLYTNGETVDLVYENGDVYVVNHKTATGVTNSGTITFAATTTAPTKGTATITVDKILWSRDGKFANVEWHYTQTAAGTATAGTGDYKFPMPANMQIDTTNITLFTTVIGGGALQTITNNMGHFLARGATEMLSGAVVAFDADFVRFMGLADGVAGAGTTSAIGATKSPLTTAAIAFHAVARIPISGWAA